MAFKSSEEAREAARKSAQVRQEKRERKRLLDAVEREAGSMGAAAGGMGEASEVSRAKLAPASDRVALVRVPVPIGDIIRKLSHDAKQGDTAAARELRAWLSQFPPDDAAADASDLDGVTRSALAAILAKALAEYEEALQMEGLPAGTQEAFDAAWETAAESEPGLPRGDGSHREQRGSRPPTAVHTPPPPPASNGSHPADGTTPPYAQMGVDDCIEEAGRGSD